MKKYFILVTVFLLPFSVNGKECSSYQERMAKSPDAQLTIRCYSAYKIKQEQENDAKYIDTVDNYKNIFLTIQGAHGKSESDMTGMVDRYSKKQIKMLKRNTKIFQKVLNSCPSNLPEIPSVYPMNQWDDVLIKIGAKGCYLASQPRQKKERKVIQLPVNRL